MAEIKCIRVKVCDGIAGIPDELVPERMYYVAIDTIRMKNGIAYGDVYSDGAYYGFMSLKYFTSI